MKIKKQKIPKIKFKSDIKLDDLSFEYALMSYDLSVQGTLNWGEPIESVNFIDGNWFVILKNKNKIYFN